MHVVLLDVTYRMDLYRGRGPCLVTRNLSPPCARAVIHSQIDLGDVTVTNRTQAPKQQTAG